MVIKMKKAIYLLLMLACMSVIFCACSSDKKDELQLGTVTNNEYKNTFLGIGAKFDSDWSFLSDEEIREQNKISKDLVGDEYKKYLDNASLIYDSAAAKNDGADNFNINLEKVNKVSKEYTPNQYLIASAENLKNALESMGASGVGYIYGTVTFAGDPRACLEIKGDFGGAEFYEKLICIRKGDYFCMVTAFSLSKEGIDDIVNNFYKLEK